MQSKESDKKYDYTHHATDRTTPQPFRLYKHFGNPSKTKHKVCTDQVLTLTEHLSDHSNILIQYFTSSGHPSGLGSRPLFFKSSIKWNTIICPCLSLPIMRMNSWNRRPTVINKFLKTKMLQYSYQRKILYKKNK